MLRCPAILMNHDKCENLTTFDSNQSNYSSDVFFVFVWCKSKWWTTYAYLPHGFQFSKINIWLVNSLHHTLALVLLTHIEFLNDWTDFTTQIHTHWYMWMNDAYVMRPNVNLWARSLQKCIHWTLFTVIDCTDLIHLHWKPIICVGCDFFELVSNHLHNECSRLAFVSPYDTFNGFCAVHFAPCARELNSRQRSETHTQRVYKCKKQTTFIDLRFWFVQLIAWM